MGIPLQYDDFALCAVGGRSENQDAWAAFRFGHDGPHSGHGWVVADGLGGRRGGAVAARMAVDAIIEYFQAQPPRLGPDPGPGPSGEVLNGALQAAQSAILAAQREQPQFSRMGSTAVVLITDGVIARWAHMGDSRLYHFRDGRLAAQTADHSVPYIMYLAGDIPLSAIRGHEDRNQLLRALGSAMESEGQWRPGILAEPVTLEPGDAFLLCSDGFWEHVLEDEMLTDLSATATARDWVERMEARLRAKVQATVEAAGRQHVDNYTALAVRMAPAP
uniref:Serine/threonine protein phosphatase PrpC n=1 Tax=Candidatus Kentrum sp. DK TaxID=2126562 RepID=A0A450S0N0_9GAMM|nr:MAG: Serine/threonine protein phosphatase PrpC [Candidatus Kentron sp. DK]